MLKLAMFLAFFAAMSSVQAEPMPEPSAQEICLSTSSILLAEYRAFQPPSSNKSIDYFNPPIAVFKRVKILNGAEITPEIKVRFDFHDGSPCLVPSEWRFTESLLPSVGSRWVLFLTRKNSEEIYETYRGNAGRFQQGLAGVDDGLELVRGCANFKNR